MLYSYFSFYHNYSLLLLSYIEGWRCNLLNKHLLRANNVPGFGLGPVGALICSEEIIGEFVVGVVRSLWCVWFFPTLWTAARQASLSFSFSRNLLKLMSIESVMPFKHLILCCPFLLLPSVFPSIRIFSKELTIHTRWPKYWSFNFNISPSDEYSGLISFRINWLDLLAVQGALKSLIQHHSLKASILWCSAFFMVQLSFLYMTTGKTIAWLYGPLLAKWYLCFLIHCLGLPWLFFQGANIFELHGCSHSLQWFWSPRK